MIKKLCDNFTHCIIDECGMCMEPESLIPIVSSGVEHVVLIGDHKQLQPIVHDHQAKKLKLDVSLFERLSRDAYMLRKQYRMVRQTNARKRVFNCIGVVSYRHWLLVSMRCVAISRFAKLRK